MDQLPVELYVTELNMRISSRRVAARFPANAVFKIQAVFKGVDEFHVFGREIKMPTVARKIPIGCDEAHRVSKQGSPLNFHGITIAWRDTFVYYL